LKVRHDEMYRGMWLWDDMLADLVGFAENDQLQHVGDIRWMSEAQVRCVTQVWILKGRNDEVYRGMWVRAMDEMLARLVGFAENDQLHYVGDINGYVRAHIVPTHVAPRFSITVFRSSGTAARQTSEQTRSSRLCRLLLRVGIADLQPKIFLCLNKGTFLPKIMCTTIGSGH